MAVMGMPTTVKGPKYVPGIGGLLETVEVIEPGNSLDDRRWEAGYQYRPDGACGDAYVWGPCSGMEKGEPVSGENVIWRPFVVEAPYTCSTFGSIDAEIEFKAGASEILRRKHGIRVEEEFWNGTAGLMNGWENLWLASPDADDVTINAGGDQPLNALANLQTAIRECQGNMVGTIHVPIRLASLWHAYGAIYINNGRFYDAFGNQVVSGGGYSGGAPVESEVVTIITTGTSGTFTISVENPLNGTIETSAPLAFNASNAQVQAALYGFSFIDNTNLTLGFAGANVQSLITLTFGGNLEFVNVDVTATDTIPDGNVTVAVTNDGGSVVDGDSLWAYATGPVEVRLSEVLLTPDTLSEAMDRGTNDITFRAERLASPSWDGCCHFAQQVIYPTTPEVP